MEGKGGIGRHSLGPVATGSADGIIETENLTKVYRGSAVAAVDRLGKGHAGLRRVGRVSIM